MKTSTVSASSYDQELIERVKSSPFYQICQNAFREATGLPLIITPVDDFQFNPCQASPKQNPFCRLINSRHGACEECIREQRSILTNAELKSSTHTCFAGLKESFVPLKLGTRAIGLLRTGQVFTQPPCDQNLQSVHDALMIADYSENEKQELLEHYRQTPVFTKEQYSGAITLLNLISLQLTEFMNRLLLESRANEPEIVSQAKTYIDDHIDEHISLDEISSEVNVSIYYFCKVFKQSTGMTFTEYVNRKRIELAKTELKHTDKSITEIAYAVGYQSLSQFNRCFLKFVGDAPRQYRHQIRKAPENISLN